MTQCRSGLEPDLSSWYKNPNIRVRGTSLSTWYVPLLGGWEAKFFSTGICLRSQLWVGSTFKPLVCNDLGGDAFIHRRWERLLWLILCNHSKWIVLRFSFKFEFVLSKFSLHLVMATWVLTCALFVLVSVSDIFMSASLKLIFYSSHSM